jgi:hypothetical protein
VPDDPISVPEDLIALKLRQLAARRELEDFSERVQAERRRQYPGDDQVVERAHWPEDLAAELQRLRTAELELVMALHRHPVMAQARAEGRAWPTEQALRKAAGERRAASEQTS